MNRSRAPSPEHGRVFPWVSRAQAGHSSSGKAFAIGHISILGIVIDFNPSRSALPMCHSNSMNELSCREPVPNTSRSNPADGGIGCVPVVIGSTVGVGVERRTEPLCNRSTLLISVGHRTKTSKQSAAVDSIISPRYCATTVSTYVGAAAGILHMSYSRCLSRAARDSCNRGRSQSFRAMRPNAHCAPTRSQHNAHNAHPLR